MERSEAEQQADNVMVMIEFESRLAQPPDFEEQAVAILTHLTALHRLRDEQIANWVDSELGSCWTTNDAFLAHQEMV